MVTERRLVPVSPNDIVEPMVIEDEDADRHWSDKVSNGILVGARWISWGLVKGAHVTGQLVEQVKKRGRILQLDTDLHAELIFSTFLL